MVKSGQKAHFCNAIVYESYAGSPKPPSPELCPLILPVLLFLLCLLSLSSPLLLPLCLFLFVIIGRLVHWIRENL
jgi:hypothetical protein